MARYKYLDYNQITWIPVEFDKQILPGTFEHTLSRLIDRHVDTEAFAWRYMNDACGAPAYNPTALLKIILYAYYHGIKSSRRIEAACRENIVFIALSANSKPDFTTIANFISSMEKEIVSVFSSVLAVCQRMRLISGQHLAIDGCKLSSNAAKEWSGTHKDLAHKKDKIKARLSVLLKEHRKIDNKESRKARQLKRRIKRHDKQVDKIQTFLKTNDPRPGKRGGEIQSNITDNESAKLKSAHGMLQGYNGIALVDGKHQIILSAEAFGVGQEYNLLEPTLNRFKCNAQLASLPDNILQKCRLLADANYFSEANLKMLHEQGINAYIPDSEFRKRDPRFKTAVRYKDRIGGRVRVKQKFKPEDFKYNKSKDQFTCPAGKTLKRTGGSTYQNDRDTRRYVARKEDCFACNLQDRCFQGKNTKRRNITMRYEDNKPTYSARMIKKIDSLAGRKIYSRRMGIVEPVFANIAFAKNLNRFTLRSKVKVDTQWQLYAIVHNIEKIANYGKPGLL